MKKVGLILVGLLVLALCACGHTHAYSEQVIEPTCTEGGYTRYTCECGDTYDDKAVEATGHTFVYNNKEATCTEPGWSEGTCACGYTESGDVPAKGHQYGEWTTIKDSTLTEVGTMSAECSVCGDKITQEIPLKEPAEYNVTYDLNGGHFVGGYATVEELTNAFLADFNKYGDGSTVTKENFQSDSHPCVKTSLANSKMLEDWNWLWVYMLEHLQEYNKGQSDPYINDTYPILERMIMGDTTAVGESANARTSIRSYLHGLFNSMKGCGAVNATFAVYSPDFSSAEAGLKLLAHQYDLTATVPNGEALPVPIREGYKFAGWKNEKGIILEFAKSHGLLVATWEEINPVKKIEITNKVEQLHLDASYQLTWAITPSDAGNLRVKFESSDTSVASIDENGRITTYKAGTVTFKIISLSQGDCTDTMTVDVITPGYFDISYETNSYVTVGNSILLNATYIDQQGKTNGVNWKSLNEALATVDANGRVTGKAVGVVKIRATAKTDATKYQDFVVTIVGQDISEGLKLVLDAHESNIFIKYDLPVGSGRPAYYSDIFGSVSRLLYNKELEIDYTYNKKSNEKYGSDLPGRIMSSIEFVVVHYTGNFSAGADGAAHGDWFAQPKSENNTSIHYSTGNDGIFKGLDEQYRAAHAGDDGSRQTVSEFSWIDTPVEVLDTDPEFPVVTITSNATFAINGRDTGVKVPEETKFGRGYVTDSKWLNDQGLGVNVKDGKYQIGTSWWCYTQVGEGRICSNGGNRKSIGIESAVNVGSDLWYTWQITAQLVADIMQRHDLDITKVKGHHFFSAKNCPQPMLENDMEIWWEFIDLVKAEYAKITECDGYEFSFESESDLVNEHGRVTGQSNHSQIVTYKVTVEKDGKTETIELATVVEGSYNR